MGAQLTLPVDAMVWQLKSLGMRSLLAVLLLQSQSFGNGAAALRSGSRRTGSPTRLFQGTVLVPRSCDSQAGGTDVLSIKRPVE